MSAENQNLHLQTIQNKIYHLRSQAVMLDRDLATIYGYTTKDFNRQVKNNITKFDSDFRFQLTSDEILYLRRNFSTANISSKSRTLPYVFTEPGIYMLMTVLKGELAIQAKQTPHTAFPADEKLHYYPTTSPIYLPSTPYFTSPISRACYSSTSTSHLHQPRTYTVYYPILTHTYPWNIDIRWSTYPSSPCIPTTLSASTI